MAPRLLDDRIDPVAEDVERVKRYQGIGHTIPDSGHGSLLQFHESFTRQTAAFLGSDSTLAPY